MDALYMTIITIATCRLQEIRPLGEAGRVFNMVLNFFRPRHHHLFAASVVRFMVEAEFEPSWGAPLGQKNRSDEGHYIICATDESDGFSAGPAAEAGRSGAIERNPDSSP